VTGFASERIDERLGELQDRHGLRIETVFNPKALEWNNAYSLWCAREHFGRGVLLANGDTVHPSSVEEVLMHAQGTADLVLALDQHKLLGEEEMKVHVTEDGLLDRINKALDPAGAQGEYIGVTLIEPHAAGPLAGALEATFNRDPQLYYEDGFQELADRGGRVATAPIGTVAWVEVDDHQDLARAREVACHC
jgi:choline kinase